MRIIDKNKDYYDYLQSPDDNTVVFDRRGSYILSKDMMIEKMQWLGHYHNSDYRNVLFQCGANFWLFLVELERDYNTHYINTTPVVDYDIKLLASWKDYNKPNELLKIDLLSDVIGLKYDHKTKSYKLHITDKDVEEFISEHKNNSKIRIETSINTFHRFISTKNNRFGKETITVPILKNSGFASIIDSMELFCAIEEYLSIEKTATEKTEPIGATNDDKIIMHGFDTVNSFRPKRKA